eukprot:CAMPEP_0177427812 /NCGR_PEP_ID=MMETSP0368-20130122/74249_1 /TAXON_ID=447022 ORGANISM="Scrippsiella hangoei-like, Strain SHHI-4" /NCGR_SAMPLE_ID=MMETSP0368 /ASSEMBLY_ACC=CAM_ASM_000363 /LENGTH=31 /DNA_ID= /DNA_START= /DNA_END= /DNA_ORIENTATION=
MVVPVIAKADGPEGTASKVKTNIPYCPTSSM